MSVVLESSDISYLLVIDVFEGSSFGYVLSNEFVEQFNMVLICGTIGFGKEDRNPDYGRCSPASRLYFYAVPISLFGEKLKACGGILDGASYGDRDPHRSLCPYEERCIGWFLFI